MRDAALPRVLVADDEPANILLIAHALKDECEVIQVSSGTDVLERVVVGDIDLILLDVVMPGLDGFEICKVLKSSPFTRHPVIFVTALTSVMTNRGLDVGAVTTSPADPPGGQGARARTSSSRRRDRSRSWRQSTR